MTERKTMAFDRHLAWLVAQHGRLEGRVFPLQDGWTAGSDTRANVQLDGYVGLASLHAKFTFREGWLLYNVGGGTTRVGNRDVAPGATGKVHDGEPVDLGTLRLVFKCL